MRTTMTVAFKNALLLPLLILSGLLILPIQAQNPELQQRVAEMKQASVKNKQALAQYTWVEQVTISLKGEQKKQEHFQVRLGPDGKPQKTSLDPPAQPAESGGRLKKHVVEKKKEEYKEYADQMKQLAQQYVPPDKDLLDKAYQQGNITLGGVAGNPDQAQLVIHNYLKPQDSMTLIFDKTQKELLQVKIASYMDDPKDAMNLTVQFSKLPDGTNHISSLVIDGVSKQLNVAIQNSNYQHL
ncbi:MAG TPA: hypothetical protein VJX72_05345 [Candidatus Acidoferrum sp.]|nr:hypothetical protein [Candidatus Acidoferrum sp.]